MTSPKGPETVFLGERTFDTNIARTPKTGGFQFLILNPVKKFFFVKCDSFFFNIYLHEFLILSIEVTFIVAIFKAQFFDLLIRGEYFIDWTLASCELPIILVGQFLAVIVVDFSLPH